jgi:type II secretory pathway component GspD/PulD (secretin)
MGGVYKISETGSNNGLPWFKDIPVLGTFFRSTGIDDFEEEILFFITPRIVEGSFDDDSMKASL